VPAWGHGPFQASQPFNHPSSPAAKRVSVPLPGYIHSPLSLHLHRAALRPHSPPFLHRRGSRSVPRGQAQAVAEAFRARLAWQETRTPQHAPAAPRKAGRRGRASQIPAVSALGTDGGDRGSSLVRSCNFWCASTIGAWFVQLKPFWIPPLQAAPWNLHLVLLWRSLCCQNRVWGFPP